MARCKYLIIFNYPVHLPLVYSANLWSYSRSVSMEEGVVCGACPRPKDLRRPGRSRIGVPDELQLYGHSRYLMLSRIWHTVKKFPNENDNEQDERRWNECRGKELYLYTVIESCLRGRNWSDRRIKPSTPEKTPRHGVTTENYRPYYWFDLILHVTWF